MSYTDDLRENFHRGLFRDDPEFLKLILEWGIRVLYGDECVRNQSGEPVLMREVIAQCHASQPDILVTGYLQAMIRLALLKGDGEWFEIDLAGKPLADRFAEENQQIADTAPSEFEFTVNCVRGEIADGQVYWRASLPHDSELQGTRWPFVLPLEVGSCRPETLLYHIRTRQGFARWPYGMSTAYVFRVNKEGHCNQFGGSWYWNMPEWLKPPVKE